MTFLTDVAAAARSGRAPYRMPLVRYFRKTGGRLQKRHKGKRQGSNTPPHYLLDPPLISERAVASPMRKRALVFELTQLAVSYESSRPPPALR